MIPFLDLKRINLKYETAFSEALRQVLNSGWYILGDQVRQFETNFAEYCGTKYSIGVGNGLDALTLIFEGYKALGTFKDGDEVILPSNTFIASALAVTKAGLTPVLVEPGSDFLIDCNKIKEKITNRTVAVMPVHLYGQVCDMNTLDMVAKQYGLKIIEDSAQAHGALYQGRRTGNLGHAAGFSFYPGKNLGALGDGGAVTTDDVALAEVVACLGNYGSPAKYTHMYKGVNSRLDELQATFLSIKLKDLDSDNLKRRKAAQYYLENIKNPLIDLPKVNSEEGHVWHLFVVRTKKRDLLAKHLLDKKIQTVIHYPTPIHKQTAYKELCELDLHISEDFSATSLSLPIYPGISPENLQYIVNSINEYSE